MEFFFFNKDQAKEFLGCVMNSFTETSTYFRTKLSKNNLLHWPGTFFSLLPRIHLMHSFFRQSSVAFISHTLL